MDRRRRFLTALGLAGAAAACLLVSGCSPGTDYPSLFPAVHDMPPPRAEAPMNPDQVQQATEQLVIDRDHLNSEAQEPGAAKAPSGGATNRPAKVQPAPAAAGAQGAAATSAGPQTAAGAETK